MLRVRSLRQRLDNNKGSQYLLEMTMYLSYLDPLTTSEQTIRDKIISLCVEKYQHTKIKSNCFLKQKHKFHRLLLLSFKISKRKRKNYFSNLWNKCLTTKFILSSNTQNFSIIVLSLGLFLRKLKDSSLSSNKLVLLLIEVFFYSTSIRLTSKLQCKCRYCFRLKKTGLELEGDPNIYKMVAT